ncbi:MAG: YhfC family intramembrane metalloprotease [Lachnospiraceae bacterium]|nr:YhfC family intramembrane metalloprotease [Lachnospiraceae bacterium]
MVHESATLGIWFTLFVSFMVPLLGVIIFTLRNKKKGIPGAWIAGAFGFYIFQILFRFPILNYMSEAGVLQRMQQSSLILYALFLALTAALFETTARFAVAKIIEKRGLSYKRSIAAGMGHGGIESMILIGMTYISNLTYVAMIGNGTFDKVVEDAAASGIDVTELLEAKDALINTSGFIFALAGYERLMTMVMHVFLTVLICYFVIQKQSPKGFVLCFLAHGFVDFVTGYVGMLSTKEAGSVLSQNTVYAICYIFLTAVAALSVWGCYKLYPDWDAIRKRTTA